MYGDHTINELVSLYNDNLSNILDKHAPYKTATITIRPEAPWFNSTTNASTKRKRALERRWRSSNLKIDKNNYTKYVTLHIKVINTAKESHFTEKVENSDNDQKKLFEVLNTLLGKESPKLPCSPSELVLAGRFNTFFIDKIKNIRRKLDDTPCDYSPVLEPRARQDI